MVANTVECGLWGSLSKSSPFLFAAHLQDALLHRIVAQVGKCRLQLVHQRHVGDVLGHLVVRRRRRSHWRRRRGGRGLRRHVHRKSTPSSSPENPNQESHSQDRLQKDDYSRAIYPGLGLVKLSAPTAAAAVGNEVPGSSLGMKKDRRARGAGLGRCTAPFAQCTVVTSLKRSSPKFQDLSVCKACFYDLDFGYIGILDVELCRSKMNTVYSGQVGEHEQRTGLTAPELDGQWEAIWAF